MIWNWRLLPLTLLLASLVSFGWAMRKFFVKPSGDSLGMKVIRMTSTVCAVLNFGTLLATPWIPARQALAAASIYLASLALFFWSLRANRQRALSTAFSLDPPRHLVNWGPYRWVRHPFYCAYLMTWSAGFVATGRWWLLPGIAVMFVVYLRAAKVEEQKFALSPLAESYREYQQLTGCFFPMATGWMKVLR
jgi:protein-S-isoprenylcysteine O-methyltransferase Ste14